MVVLKSSAMGFLSLVLLSIVTALALPFALGRGVSWDPVQLLKHSVTTWLMLAVYFLIGFAWEYYRLTRWPDLTCRGQPRAVFRSAQLPLETKFVLKVEQKSDWHRGAATRC